MIVCCFLYLLFCCTLCKNKLVDYLSAGLSRCIYDGHWEVVVGRYFTTVDPEWKPYTTNEQHPWPSEMDDDIKEIFTTGDGIKVGIPFHSFAPNTFWDHDTQKYAGFEIDVLESCVIPFIKEKYDLNDEFKYEVLSLPQVSDMEGFFENVLHRLDNHDADIITSISILDDREDKVEFSQIVFVSGVNCVRADYETEDVEITDRSSIDNEDVKIEAAAGSVYDHMIKEFTKPQITSNSEGDDLLPNMVNDPKAHLYCAAVEQVSYWYKETSYTEVDYPLFTEDTLGEFKDDLSWVTKLDDDDNSGQWWVSLIVTLPVLIFTCCILCVVVALAFCGTVLLLSIAVVGVGGVGAGWYYIQVQDDYHQLMKEDGQSGGLETQLMDEFADMDVVGMVDNVGSIQ